MAVSQMLEQMSRQEFMAWARVRALEYVDRGELDSALSSIASDLQQRTDTRRHGGIRLGYELRAKGLLETQREMRHFIEGFV